MEIAIIAGEVSGDIQAGRLVKEIKNVSPSVKIWGVSGPNMRAEGVQSVSDITELAVIGFFEVIKNYGRIRKVFYKILDEIKKRRPNAVILVDYPGFNMRLAKKIKQLGIPVFYYISPQVWAWGKGRIKEIKELVDKMIVIFPFEKELYEREGVPVEFVGHPIIDVISERVSNKDEFRKQLNVRSDEKLIGILPGSRTQEVKRHLPVFLAAAREIKYSAAKVRSILLREELYAPSSSEQAPSSSRAAIQDAKFVVGAASQGAYELINSITKKESLLIPVLLGQTYDIMEASDLILTSSGTATLETTCFGTPMVVIYKLSWLTYFFIRSIADIPFIAMANVIAGRKIVPEFVQGEANTKNIAEEALKILKNPDNVRRELIAVRQKLGERGAAKKAAKIICEAITG